MSITTKCTQMGCKCTNYVENKSKWSVGKCKVCPHTQRMHGINASQSNNKQKSKITTNKHINYNTSSSTSNPYLDSTITANFISPPNDYKQQQQHAYEEKHSAQSLNENYDIAFIGMDDVIIDMVDRNTLRQCIKSNKMLILISSLSTHCHQQAAQTRIQNLLRSKKIPFQILDGAQSENRAERNELFAISKLRGKYPQIFMLSNKQSMLTCSVLEIKTPSIPQKPKKGCRAYFTGAHVGDVFVSGHVSMAYTVDAYSEIVGAGSYNKNTEAFPKAVANTFDGIAIDANTRVIIYEKEYFKGSILLDQVGPALINNCLYKNTGLSYKVNSMNLMTKIFMDAELQSTFPPERRYWSVSNMHSWSTGSVKVVGAK